MARDNADIDRIKAEIPVRYQPPRDADGVLTNHFSLVDSHRESTALQGSEISKLDRYNLGTAFVGQDAADAAPSFLLNGAQATARNIQITEAGKRQRDLEQIAFDQVRDAIDARLAQLDAQLAAIEANLAKITERRLQIGEEMDALSQIEERRRTGKKLDPANKADAALLRLAKLSADEVNGDDYMTAINARRRDLDSEDATQIANWNAQMKLKATVEAERKAVASVKSDIELVDTEEARILAERRATTVLGQLQLGEAAFQSDSGRAKALAANAVATNESGSKRGDSATLNRDAVGNDHAAMYNRDGANFELDTPNPGQSGSVPPKPL